MSCSHARIASVEQDSKILIVKSLNLHLFAKYDDNHNDASVENI